MALAARFGRGATAAWFRYIRCSVTGNSSRYWRQSGEVAGEGDACVCWKPIKTTIRLTSEGLYCVVGVLSMKRLLSASFSLLVVLTLAAPRIFAGDDPKKDPDQIGSRDVSKGVNFYSLE